MDHTHSLSLSKMPTTYRRKPSKHPLPVAVFLFSLFILPLPNDCKSSDETLNPEEKQALIDFNKTIPHSTKNFTWNPSEPPCSWKGVYCDESNKTVLYLRLPGKSFVGPIPNNTVGRLTSLRVLSLRVNGFHGELPPDFTNLTSLTRLSLNDNNFSGAIPPGFSEFTNLIRLSLNNNSFSGQLPYIDAKELKVFNVSFNKLNTSIPYPFRKFSQSAFSPNVFICGPPTNIICNDSYQPSPYYIKNERHPKRQSPVIVAVSVASGLLLLLLLWSVRRKVINDHQTKQPPLKGAEGNDVVMLFDDQLGGRMIQMEDLLKASAVVLGEGSVGISYKQVLEGKKNYAATVVVTRLKGGVVVTKNEFRTRMEGLGKMKNKNVVPLMAYYYSKEEKWLVYDYMPAASLYARLHDKGEKQKAAKKKKANDSSTSNPDEGSIDSGRTQVLDWEHRLKIALGAARGLAYLHDDKKDGKSVVHGNINSSNILLGQGTNSELASLSDYGLNTLFGESRSLDNHVTGYWAPEVHSIRDVTPESDVYSFGLLLLELLTGKSPEQASLGKEGVHFCKLLVASEEESKDEIFDVELRMDDHNVEKTLKQLFKIAKECVSEQPNQRPTMDEVVSMMDDMFDDHSKGCDYTPSTEAQDTPSTITLDTPSTITP